MQETLLFGNTVRENIAFGRPEATQEEIEMVARLPRPTTLSRVSNGYDTDVGERGVTLSAANVSASPLPALLLDPRILILDDATSSVDTDTESRSRRRSMA